MISLELHKRSAALGCALAIEDGVVYIVELEHKSIVFGGTMAEVAEELSELEEAEYENDKGK